MSVSFAKRFIKMGALGVSSFLIATLGSASVSLKNGNFFVGYTDIVYPGGFEPKIERVYNSKTPYKGIFGWGWGNEYEVFLTVSADGSVMLHEYGGGAENRFSPTAFNAQELERAVTMITEVAQKGGGLANANALDTYKKKLRNNATFRNEEWEKYRHEGKLKARELAVNTKLVSNKFSYQYVTRIKDGYFRTFENGRVERFNDAGRLVRIQDRNSNFIDIVYNKTGKPEKITDNFNRKIFITFNSKGLVEKIQGENNKEANYKYNDNDELVWSKDVDANTYTLKYGTDKRHNLVEIDYTDKTSLQIAYYGREKLENVKSVKDRDGTITEYAYEGNQKEPGFLGIGVNVKGSDGKPISSSRYDYFTKVKAGGEEWTYRLVSTIDGEKTETTYNECCGLPLLIKKGNEETAFEYNPRGNVTKKITPTEITQLTYDDKAQKVSRVSRYSKVNRKQVAWSQFRYDEKANLTYAENSDKKGVRLVYDTNGRIQSMLDNKNRRITFKYNEASKPVEITDPSLGSISVSYTNSGEIKKVDSTAGRKIAMQVTSAFQNLLDIIRPAGVTLSF